MIVVKNTQKDKKEYFFTKISKKDLQ